MDPSPTTSAYTALLEESPRMGCVEGAACLCRELAGNEAPLPTPGYLQTLAPNFNFPDLEEPTEHLLNQRGSLLASAQGIRMHMALQGLDLPLESDYQIIDWNAAQGFHTMALIEWLIARDLLDGLRHITLIHTSSRALERAGAGVRSMVDDCTVTTLHHIAPFGAGLPAHRLRYLSPVIIHILPDLPHSTSIQALWQRVMRPGHTHIILSIGSTPLETEMPPDYGLHIFKTLSLNPATYTSQGGEVPLYGFVACTDSLSSPISNLSTNPSFQPSPLFQNFESDLKRIAPPDATLLHDVSLPPYRCHAALLLPGAGMLLIQSISNSNSHELNRASTLLRDMRRLLALHLPGLEGRQRVRRTIRLAILAQNHATDHLPEETLPGDIPLLGPDFLHSERGNALTYSLLPAPENPHFSDYNLNRALHLLRPPFHWETLGLRHPQDKAETKASTPGGPKYILGAPGTGKTTCLLQRAMTQASRSLRPSLIVAPNPESLRHLRHAAHTIPVSCPMHLLHICNIAELLSATPASTKNLTNPFSTKNKTHIQEGIAAEPETSYQNHTNPGTRNTYSAIYVDDAHVLTPDHIRLLEEKYLASEGQTIFALNPLESQRIIPDWPQSITIGNLHCQGAREFSPLTHRYARLISPDLPDTKQIPPQIPTFQTKDPGIPSIAYRVLQVIEHLDWSPYDTLIVAQDLSLLRHLYDVFESNLSIEIQAPFASQRQCEAFTKDMRNPAGGRSLLDKGRAYRFLPTRFGLTLLHTTQLQATTLPNLLLLHPQEKGLDARIQYRLSTRATKSIALLTYPEK